jgi:hypothetical protein
VLLDVRLGDEDGFAASRIASTDPGDSPDPEAGARELEKSENDIMRLSAHVDDVTDSGQGEVAELMRPFYLEYLRAHHVPAPS